MLKIYGLATACVSMVAFAGSAFAQVQPVRVGGLTCIAAPRIGLVLGSRQNLRCVFRSNATGGHYSYAGTMSRIGVDVGVTGGGRLFWGVFAPTSHVGYGVLRGTYVGASGNASFGVGLGAKCWSADLTVRSRCSRSPSKAKLASIWRWGLRG
jgi:Protein of unknown function (DUF992)